MGSDISRGANGLERSDIFRNGIEKAQDFIKSLPGSVQGEELEKMCPTEHSFAGGIYVRQMFIPKGTVIVGKIHRHAHPNFIMRGVIDVVSEEYGKQRIIGPIHFISKAETKRMGLALEDTIWVTIHEVGAERDLKKIEEMLTVSTYAELEHQTGEKL